MGMASTLPPDARSDLRAAGLGHIIAVSGMHVGVAALFFYTISLRLGVALGGSIAIGALLSWLPVAAYVALTGGAPSAVRAALMFSLLHVSALLGKRPHGYTLLTIAAAILLVVEPTWSISPGFHLSFSAMAILVKRDAPSGIVAQSWHVTWGTVPVSLWFFGSAALYGALSNLIAIPVFTLFIVPTAIVGLFASSILGPLALAPATWGAELILDIAALMARIPAVSSLVVLGFAGIALGLHARAWHRGTRANRWLPGPVTCVGVVLVEVISLISLRTSSDVPAEATIVVGRPGRFSSLVRAREVTCLQNPLGSPGRWPPLLRALGISSVAVTQEVSSRTSAPHLGPVREGLLQAGMLDTRALCQEVEIPWANAGLDACISMHRAAGFDSRTVLVVAATGHLPVCFVAGRWKNLQKFGTPDL